MTKQERIEKLFKPLFDIYRKKITPANEELLDIFRQTASERNVPGALIEELIMDNFGLVDAMMMY